MNSQKNSSTKVVTKKSVTSGQRQISNLSRSKRAASVKDNTKLNIAVVANTNTIKSKGNTPVIMRTGFKSELISSINCATPNYTVVLRLRINPLSRKTFTWLPTIAQNFESYKFHTLRIRYETRCSTTTSGSVILSPSYDAADSNAQAASESLLYQNKGSMDFSVWKSNVLNLNPSAMNRLYKSHTCMTDERWALSTQDEKTVDAAQVFICLDGVPSGAVVGKIFVDYDCEFFEPHSPTEPVNQGGATVWEANNPVPNSSLPFSAFPNVVVSEVTPILKNVSQLVSEGIMPAPSFANPSSVIGQLLKDYSGVLDTLTQGSLLNGDIKAYLSTNPLSPAGSAGDILLGGNLGGGITNPTQTVQMKNFSIPNGVAGQFIKIFTPSVLGGGTVDLIKHQLAAISAL